MILETPENPNLNNSLIRFSDRGFGLFVYALFTVCGAAILWQGRSAGLFPAPLPGTDQLSMIEAAFGLASGEPLPAGYLYSPAYTGFLAAAKLLTGGNLVAMRMVQCLVAGWIPVVVFHLGIRLRFGRTAARVGALLCCFYGPLLLISLDFLRAAPLALCFAGFLLALLRAVGRRSPRWFLVAGVLAGLCILGRENFIPVVAFPALMLFSGGIRRHLFRRRPAEPGRRTLRMAAALATGLVLTIAPIVVVNLVRFGSPAIVPGHTGNVVGAYYGPEAEANRLPDPGAILRRIPEELGNFLSSYEIPNSLSFYAHAELIDFLNVAAVPFHLLLALAAIGFWRFRRNPGARLTLLLIAGYALSMSLFTFFYRFRIPAVPLVAAMAGAGVTALGDWIRLRKFRTLAAALLGGALFVAATSRNPDRLRPESERRSVVYLMIRLGRYPAAEDGIERLRRDRIPSADLAEQLIRALQQEGYHPYAAELFRRWFGSIPDGGQAK